MWEIAIKISLSKLQLGQPLEALIPHQLRPNEIALLDITISHTAMVATLPIEAGHRDPFDRTIVAQALVERMPIVSVDTVLDLYGVTRVG